MSEPPDAGDPKAWLALVGADCRRLATSYLARPLDPDLVADSIPISLPSWRAGSHSAQCVLARYANGSEVPLTAPIRNVFSD